ncbi:MAG: choice-of-anchor A family protein [Phycisphaerales bacterium]|nr:choice-of-anchor A family protein [Phycisphaerales bacterium]
MRTRTAWIALSLLTLPAAAQAGMNFQFQHNLFVAGNMTSSGSDVEGSLAVGGNLNVSNYSVGLLLPNSNGASNSLVVGGNLSFNSGTVWGGNTRYGGTANLANFSSPNGTAAQGTPLNFNAVQSSYQTSSQYLSTLSSVGTVQSQFSTLTMTGTNPTLNVFNLGANAFNGISTIQISAPSSSTVLVNVAGTSNTLQFLGMSLSGGITESRVLYNFHQSTSLTLQGIGFLGSILAPNAQANFNSGVVLGNAAIGNLSGNGQWNSVPFTGDLPVPTPAAGVMTLAALGLVGARRRRA